MSTASVDARLSVFAGEARKTMAFVRRDLLVAWSYRVAFFSDWLNLLMQITLFYFVGRLVDPSQLPSFGGERVTYVEFVAVGIAITSFLQIGLSRVVTVMRNEQLMGTLESVLLTPTAPTTVQLGSVMYDLLYVPIRTFVFLALTVIVLGVRFDATGVLPATLILLTFIPIVWGLGMVSAAGVIVFRRGLGAIGFLTAVLTATSSTYFPIQLFPGWLQAIARLNPITIALTGARDALLGHAGWSRVPTELAVLVPTAVVVIMVGVFAFRAALVRERRRGTLGLY
jgi:ABC-2 type transport system permease protein